MKNANTLLREPYIQLLKDAGYRLTAQRTEILEYLMQSTHPCLIGDIAGAVLADEASVYRTIALFVELGVVEEISLQNGVRRFAISDGHHHHLICGDCGYIAHVPCTSFQEKDPHHAMFPTVTRHEVSWYGLCTQCAR